MESPRASTPTNKDPDEAAYTLKAAVMTTEPVAMNRGGLGDPAPLTSTLTIIDGSSRVKVGVLFDTGSESSYFHPSLERLGVTRQKKQFVLETLSTTRDSPEEMNGLLIGFDVEMASGLVMRVNALKHDGLGNQTRTLRPRSSLVLNGMRTSGLLSITK